jgi:uncharacterized damage-inducible protein DinB
MNAVLSPTEYATPYKRYIDHVPIDKVKAVGIVDVLDAQLAETMDFLNTIDETKSLYRYAEGKWSIRDIIQHLIDSERIFIYRALRIARNDKTPIEGFEENDYAREASADKRSWSGLILELELLRMANLQLWKNFSEEEWKAMGVASGFPVSVRALAYISAGHERHHLGVIKERYL